MRQSSFLVWRAAARSGPVVVVVALLLGLSTWFYHDSIGLYPSFIHAWAQADWLAIALKFRTRGYDFFHPATFNLLTTDGVTGAGFPVPAYLTALLMGLMGRDAPGLMRGVTLALSLGGLLALFGLVRRASGSALKGGVVVLLAFCGPIYVYYQANFLPSVPAWAAAVMGYYWFYRALEAEKMPHLGRRCLGLAVVWLALAAAMRTPFLLPLLCTLGHLVVLRPRRTAAAVGWGWVGCSYGIAFAFIAASFLYNEYLSHVYHGSMFLARLRPFVSWEQAVQVTQVVREYWLWNLLSKPQWLLGLLSVIAVLVQHGRLLLRNEWAQHWLALVAGGLAYYGLMGQQFAVHDYYLLDAFYLPLIMGFAGCVIAWRVPSVMWARLSAIGTVVVLSGAAAWQARSEQLRRISLPPTENSVLTRNNFLSSAHWLDSLGVPRTATVLVLDAYSYNLPLLLAHRQGWTYLKNANSPQNLTAKNLREALTLPADYVLTQNATYASAIVDVYPATTTALQLVASNGRISLWRIRPEGHATGTN